MKKNTLILTIISSSIITNQHLHTEEHSAKFHGPTRNAIVVNHQEQLPPEIINVTESDFVHQTTTGTSIFDKLIVAGIKNQDTGWKRLLPIIDTSELKSSNYPMYQATMGITRMAYGTGQIATGEALKFAYNNPKEAMSCFTIPAMMGIVMYDSYQRK